MGKYRVATILPLPPDQAFDLWIDPFRAPQWQERLLRVFDLTGDLGVPGATYRLDFGPGFKRTSTVLMSRRSEVHRVRQTGAGWDDETSATFEPVEQGTRVTCEYEVNFRWGPIGRAYERWLGGSGVEKKLKAELDRFVALATRPNIDARAGQMMTVDCGAGFRVVHVLAIGSDAVHLSLLPGRAKSRPNEPDQAGGAPMMGPMVTPTPLQPGLSSIKNVTIVGQPILALDGGFGVPHLALTRGTFTDSVPQPIGERAVSDEALAEVEAWQGAGGPLLGRDYDAGIGPLVVMRFDGQHRVAKVLRTDRRIVHLRIYSDVEPQAPTAVNPWKLRLDPMGSEVLGIGHIPVSLGSYPSTGTEFLRLAMVGPPELEGVRYWEEHGGGVFA